MLLIAFPVSPTIELPVWLKVLPPIGEGLCWPSHVPTFENLWGVVKGEDGERLVWKSLSGESLTSQGARSSYWMSEHPGFSSCGFSQAPSLILHPTLSSIPAFLRFLPLASAYRCDFGCVLDLFRICFSHWLAMFAFLIILFPTSCVVSCIQQMFKMFL